MPTTTAAEASGDRVLGAHLLLSLSYQIANIGKRDDASHRPVSRHRRVGRGGVEEQQVDFEVEQVVRGLDQPDSRVVGYYALAAGSVAPADASVG